MFANEPGHRDDIVFHGARQTRYGRVAGDTICPYNGQVINTHQLEQRYGEQTAPYAIRVKDNKYEDAALQRGIGSLANHKPRAQSNTEFVVSRDHINLRATKNIRNGQELFVSYGNDYHFNEPGVHTTTNRSKYHYV